jgi:hypothetical protein
VCATQLSELLPKDRYFRPSVTASRSASSRTIAADLPPSSRLTRLSCCPAMEAMRRPAAVEPVKAILSIPACDTRYSLVARSAGKMLTTPSGTPAPVNRSPSASASSAVSGDALRMTVHPASRAGTIFTRADWCGAFHGITAATTPTGSRRSSGPDALVGSSGCSHPNDSAARR